jgi:site-specific DNA-cytosine methylase
MRRIIREVQPRWVVGENVLGLVNWNGGLVFDEVQADLEAEGYEVQPFILPAASVNAPHKRDRVWFVAYRNATDTDSNGFIEKRGHDSSGKNDAWSNAQGERTADTKNPNGCDSHGIFEEQSSVGSNISGKANVEKNKIAKPTRFCQMDSTNNTERIVNEKQDFIVEGGTLVPERPSGVFSPVNRGLECNQNLFDGMGEMGASNDIPRIKSMDGVAENTLCSGRLYGEPEQEGAEIREQRNACPGDSIGVCGAKVAGVPPDTDSLRHTSCGEGTEAQGIGCGNNGEQKERSEQTEWPNGLLGLQPNAPDTASEGLEGRKRGCSEGKRPSSNSEPNAPNTDHQGLQGGEVNGSAGELREESHKLTTRFVQPNWENFPTQSPIRTGNDGLSTELDGITFSKWRNESIKAAGNAIVPQVVFQIFKAINEYREKYP